MTTFGWGNPRRPRGSEGTTCLAEDESKSTKILDERCILGAEPTLGVVLHDTPPIDRERGAFHAAKLEVSLLPSRSGCSDEGSRPVCPPSFVDLLDRRSTLHDHSPSDGPDPSPSVVDTSEAVTLHPRTPTHTQSNQARATPLPSFSWPFGPRQDGNVEAKHLRKLRPRLKSIL